jgi:biopolymer transport protein ExbB/TolQ
MEYIVIGILAVATIVFVTYPLFGAQRRLHHLEDAFDLGDSKQLDYLTLKRDRLTENLNELDFEHEMGKLSEGDYANIRAGYMSDVEQVDESLERLRAKKEIEEAIENDVRSRRRIK